MKVLMLCHNTPIDGGTIHQILKSRDDVELDLVMAYDDPLQNIAPDAHDLTIFMGGSMGVYNRDIFPYLEREIEYLKARFALNKPYLGICLGSQLMSAALGGQVSVGQNGKEVGWHPVTVTDDGKLTALGHLDQGQTDILQWHGDTFTMPENCTLMGSSEAYTNQIITHGDKALGLQFHPEVTREILEMWMVSGFQGMIDSGIDPHEFRAGMQDKLSVLQAQTEKFFNAWLKEVMN